MSLMKTSADWSKLGMMRILSNTRPYTQSGPIFPLFLDCFEDLLEGLDDDEDLIDEALLV